MCEHLAVIKMYFSECLNNFSKQLYLLGALCLQRGQTVGTLLHEFILGTVMVVRSAAHFSRFSERVSSSAPAPVTAIPIRALVNIRPTNKWADLALAIPSFEAPTHFVVVDDVDVRSTGGHWRLSVSPKPECDLQRGRAGDTTTPKPLSPPASPLFGIPR